MTRTIDGHNYTTSFQLDTANQVTQMTYPSNRAVNIGHDSKGRVTSVGSYLSGVTYDGIGRVAGTTLGNGVTEGFGYDATRMQLTSQTATKNGGPTNGLMNLTYGYDAAAGQMGTGSTAGNVGQLISISGTINSTTESAAYSYDDLGRLVTSNQTSNGSSAQRRFAYDRWGNRTGMRDAMTGGTQIQSIALQQSGGAPTNQIQSVTSGSTVNYTYDAAGNVTNDGVHGYTYDAENRIVSVDGGSTATYAYDQSNRRYKKTIGSSVTHYVWQGSQVIAEHNGSTGASTADHVYSGSRMIAKVAGLTTQYFLSDRLSVRVMLSTSGNVIGRQGHLPFGEDFGESGTQEKHHFTNYERDAVSGLDYGVNRGFSPNLGRFQQADPYKPSGEGKIPQSWNRYAYTINDPVTFVDPLGLFLANAQLSTSTDAVTCSGPQLIVFGVAISICDTIGGGGGSLVPSPPSRFIHKPFNFRLKCGSKDAEHAMAELQRSFTNYASFSESGFGASSIDFQRVPITANARISIHTVYGGLGIPFPADAHVRVIRFDALGWTFETESDHVFYPGTIAFSMRDIRNRNGENILFQIMVNGYLNGRTSEIAYDNGVDEFEDAVWDHLRDAVQAGICGI